MARRFLPYLALSAALLLPAGCKHGHGHSDDYVYVIPKQAFLRDRIAAVSNKVASVGNGEKLQVIEHSRRFLKVKTDKGQVGWLEEHAVIDQPAYDAFANLRREHEHDPAVATGVLRDEMYAHVAPGRESDRFLLLPENDKLALLVRASLPKPTPEQIFQSQLKKQAAKVAAEKAEEDALRGRTEAKTEPKQAAQDTPAAKGAIVHPQPAPAAGKKAAATATPPQMEDWWLVRDGAGRTGWVLARRVDVDVPDEVVRYAEGQKIVGAYLLAKVHDEDSPFPDKEAPEYVTVLNPYKDGLPYDFSMVRVFVWNAKKHRYEGGLREKDLVGYLPVTVKEETLKPLQGDKPATVPTFTLKLAVDGAVPAIDPATGLLKSVPTFPATYRLDGEQVTRVLTPGEEAPTPASSASPEEQARQRERAKRRAEWRAAHPHPHPHAHAAMHKRRR